MTDLEILKRAKIYIDKLARGVNPLDDSVIPDDEVVNNVRISRCFFYVSEILEEVIENGGTVQKPKIKRDVPFRISFGKRNEFDFSDEPIGITEITRRINALIEYDDMKRISYGRIRDKLLDLGMLEKEEFTPGKTTYVPSVDGEQLGIGLESRTGQYGTYYVTVYDRNAQQFIIDNLDAF